MKDRATCIGCCRPLNSLSPASETDPDYCTICEQTGGIPEKVEEAPKAKKKAAPKKSLKKKLLE